MSHLGPLDTSPIGPVAAKSTDLSISGEKTFNKLHNLSKILDSNLAADPTTGTPPIQQLHWKDHDGHVA